MKTDSGRWGLAVVLVVSWALPVYAVVYNQLHPGYETALGVAYGFLIGCGVHVVAAAVWIAVRRARLKRAERLTLLVSFLLLVVLAFVSDSGALSTVG